MRLENGLLCDYCYQPVYQCACITTEEEWNEYNCIPPKTLSPFAKYVWNFFKELRNQFHLDHFYADESCFNCRLIFSSKVKEEHFHRKNIQAEIDAIIKIITEKWPEVQYTIESDLYSMVLTLDLKSSTFRGLKVVHTIGIL